MPRKKIKTTDNQTVMKTTIKIYYSKVSVNDVTHRENNVMASCKSEPVHRLDCERFVSCENNYSWNDDLQSFIRRLKNFIYEDSSLEVVVIDNRDFSLPLYK